MQQHNPAILMSRLKQETEGLHARLEKLPYFIALADGVLPLAAYVNQLRAFAMAFGTLEHETATITEPSVRAILEAGESRFNHLLRDLSCFGDKMIPEILDAKTQADAMAAKIRLRGIEDSVSLIGYIYVLKGTILGNRVHLPDVQHTFNVDSSNGAAFFFGYGARTEEIWTAFVSHMSRLNPGGEATERIVAAACEAFDCLERIHTALFPLPTAECMTFASTSINPEAGNHAVPVDAREISAAIAAGRLCREEFPYFDERYGERGKRFTDSDAAWLATLAKLTIPLIISQVAWLGGVLASRGMPRITLERQLFCLHKELIKAIPDNRTEYDKLTEAASWLKTERLRHVPSEIFESLCHSFVAKTENESDGKMKGTGSLIVSAVSDEKAGIMTAVQSIEAWLTDTERFSAAWIATVKDTIAQARSAAI